MLSLFSSSQEQTSLCSQKSVTAQEHCRNTTINLHIILLYDIVMALYKLIPTLHSSIRYYFCYYFASGARFGDVLRDFQWQSFLFVMYTFVKGWCQGCEQPAIESYGQLTAPWSCVAEHAASYRNKALIMYTPIQTMFFFS